MGFYRCYLCNKEFWTVKGLDQHYKKDRCQRVTKDMKELMMKPYFRVLIQVHYVQPAKKIPNEKFLYSYNVRTNEWYDTTEQLTKVAKEIGISLESEKLKGLEE